MSGCTGREVKVERQGPREALAGGRICGIHGPEGWPGTGEGRTGSDQRTEPQMTPRLKVRERKKSINNVRVGDCGGRLRTASGRDRDKLRWLLRPTGLLERVGAGRQGSPMGMVPQPGVCHLLQHFMPMG